MTSTRIPILILGQRTTLLLFQSRKTFFSFASLFYSAFVLRLLSLSLAVVLKRGSAQHCNMSENVPNSQQVTVNSNVEETISIGSSAFVKEFIQAAPYHSVMPVSQERFSEPHIRMEVLQGSGRSQTWMRAAPRCTSTLLMRPQGTICDEDGKEEYPNASENRVEGTTQGPTSASTSASLSVPVTSLLPHSPASFPSTTGGRSTITSRATTTSGTEVSLQRAAPIPSDSASSPSASSDSAPSPSASSTSGEATASPSAGYGEEQSQGLDVQCDGDEVVEEDERGEASIQAPDVRSDSLESVALDVVDSESDGTMDLDGANQTQEVDVGGGGQGNSWRTPEQHVRNKRY